MPVQLIIKRGTHRVEKIREIIMILIEKKKLAYATLSRLFQL